MRYAIAVVVLVVVFAVGTIDYYRTSELVLKSLTLEPISDRLIEGQYNIRKAMLSVDNESRGKQAS